MEEVIAEEEARNAKETTAHFAWKREAPLETQPPQQTNRRLTRLLIPCDIYLMIFQVWTLQMTSSVRRRISILIVLMWAPMAGKDYQGLSRVILGLLSVLIIIRENIQIPL